MDISRRSKELTKLFSLEKRTVIEEGRLEIIPHLFTQVTGQKEIDAFQRELATTAFCPATDDLIQENKSFTYPIFAPIGSAHNKKAILLLHGLNERSWEKYLPWAEYLAMTTNRPVILFPIAFHINRTPTSWCNPREVLPWVSQRKEKIKENRNSTFVNLALSSRISQHPLRFYASGRESAYNVCQLMTEIKKGEHSLFAKDTEVNIFAYSIGALLSQVLLLANPGKLFTDTRLFMFCGGSVFNQMNGNARDILDQEAFFKLQQYFTTDFIKRKEIPDAFPQDYLEAAFKSMIKKDELPTFRESFFQKACERIRAVSLKKDVVVPTQGIIKALGKSSEKILEEFDFPFNYSHQKPFSDQSATDSKLVNKAFNTVFSRAAAHLI